MKAAYATDKTDPAARRRLRPVLARHMAMSPRPGAPMPSFDKIMPRHPIVLAALADLKAGKVASAPLCGRRRTAPPRCCTALARPADGRATNWRPWSICGCRST